MPEHRVDRGHRHQGVVERQGAEDEQRQDPEPGPHQVARPARPDRSWMARATMVIAAKSTALALPTGDSPV